MARGGLVCAVLAALLLLPGSAFAAPDCKQLPTSVRYLARDQGMLESVKVDQLGPLVFSVSQDGPVLANGLMRIDRPGATPQPLAAIESPGGIVLQGRSLIVGTGNSVANGAVGDFTGPAGLLKVNPRTGAFHSYATGLSMANGVDRAPDGTIYATNDMGANVDRIADGKTQRGWAQVRSGNGIAIDAAGRYAYVNQTFQPAAIQRIDLRTGSVSPFAVAEPADIAAGLDGLARDGAGNLYAAANGGGQIWRIDPSGAICVLLRGMPAFPDGPSAVTVGSGKRFPATNLYVVAFNGDVIELAGAAASS